MAERIALRVLTPDGVVLEQEVDQVILRAWDGDMGVLPGHEPCAVALDYGLMRLFTDQKESGTLAVMGGFATVRDDEVVVLSPVAEPPDRLEETLQRIERERAENVRREQRSQAEIQRAESALRRMLLGQDVGAATVVADPPPLADGYDSQDDD